MKVLFIGGTGRLSKDVALLATKEHEVFLLTRGSENRKIFVHPDYKMLYGDIRNIEECKIALEPYHFDVVVDFLQMNQKQLENSLAVLEGKYDQYIFVSTATVYENEPNEIISEACTRIGNERWKYSYNKYLCEMYLKEYFKNKKEYYTIIRPYVTYGNTRIPYPLVPRDSKKEWSFIQRIIDHRPIPTFAKGLTITTLTHTKDFAIGVVGLFGNPLAYNNEFHIANDKQSTWGEVLDNLDQILDQKSIRMDFKIDEIIEIMPEYYGVLNGDKARNTLFDNSKICEAVPAYCCSVSLKEGLADMISFYNSNPALKEIDYRWNGKLDRLCGQGNCLKTYRIEAFRNKLDYILGYYVWLNKINESALFECIRKGLKSVKNFILR